MLSPVPSPSWGRVPSLRGERAKDTSPSRWHKKNSRQPHTSNQPITLMWPFEDSPHQMEVYTLHVVIINIPTLITKGQSVTKEDHMLLFASGVTIEVAQN